MGLIMQLVALYLSLDLTTGSPVGSHRDVEVLETPVRRHLARSDFALRDTIGYKAWVDKMVEEGKMYRPVNTSASIAKRDLEKREFSFSITNIVCAAITNNEATTEDARTRFCQNPIWLQYQYINTIKWFLQNQLCTQANDNNAQVQCERYIRLALDGAAVLTGAGWSAICDDVWGEIEDTCGYSGGTGDIVIINNDPNLVDTEGTIEAFWREPDALDDTCPAIPANNAFVCYGENA